MKKTLLFTLFVASSLLPMSLMADIDNNEIILINEKDNIAAGASGGALLGIQVNAGPAQAGSVDIGCAGHDSCSGNKIFIHNKGKNIAIGDAQAGSVRIK